MSKRETNTMPTNRDTTDTCPICNETPLARVRCSNTGCTYVVITCPRCDKDQVVRAFVADHEKDCAWSAPIAATPLRVLRTAA